ncbi:MAG: hypothetical protein RJA42_1803, partial [Bacteroidota bacterium]
GEVFAIRRPRKVDLLRHLIRERCSHVHLVFHLMRQSQL